MKKLLALYLVVLQTIIASAQTDLSALHAPPTPAEIAAVKADWASRDHTAYNWTVLHSGQFSGFTVEIVSHKVDGNLHYAVVRYPENYDPAGSYPVLVSNHGGATGVGVNNINQFQATCYRNFFIAVPSFRGEVLRTGNLAPVDYTSEGIGSLLDGDTDDALALLTGVLEIPGADENRVGVLGPSRGGGVSHLMACKDDRIKRASIFYGATDHLAFPGLQQRMENYVDNGSNLNAVESTTYNYGVAPYLAGTLTLAEARLELLRRSAIYFIDEMPLPYEVHHGSEDNAVNVNHSRLLAEAFTGTGVTSPDFNYYEYEGAGHGLPNDTGAPAIREAYLCELNSAILPVELIEFMGSCQEDTQQILLQWTAIIGPSANAFILQNSTNGKDWKAIETLPISDSPNELAHYNYSDRTYPGGVSYYRLQEIDLDGNIEYHPMIEVVCGSNSLSISPNPTKSSVVLKYDRKTNEYLTEILVFDAIGQQVLARKPSETESLEIDLGHLPKGVYTFRVLVGGHWLVERVVLN